MLRYVCVCESLCLISSMKMHHARHPEMLAELSAAHTVLHTVASTSYHHWMIIIYVFAAPHCLCCCAPTTEVLKLCIHNSCEFGFELQSEWGHPLVALLKIPPHLTYIYIDYFLWPAQYKHIYSFANTLT